MAQHVRDDGSLHTLGAAEAELDPGEKRRDLENDPPGKKLLPPTADNTIREQQAHGRETHASFLQRNRLLVVIGAILGVVIVVGGALYWDYTRHFESTDDAFIDSRIFAIAPKVSGYVTAVPVTDNRHVSANGVIARIDDRDYRIALEVAEAQVVAAQASIQSSDAQIAVQQAQIDSAQAQVERARASLQFSEEDAARYKDLAQRGFGTVQQAQQTDSKLEEDAASRANAQAVLAAAKRQMETLKAQRASAEASLAQSKAQRDQAKLNLAYTTVTAAQSGRVVKLTAAVGQFAQVGTNLSMFVPDEVWVIANFKETQLVDMRPGQAVTLRIDAYPGRAIHGHVASIQPGSGTAFSLLPAENATGNFVKIVQRVPVKLVMDNPPTEVALGPGMSVVPTVRVHPEPSLFERFIGRR